MRWTAVLGALALAGCVDTGIHQVGPGDGADDTGTQPGEGGGWSCDRRGSQGICEEYVGDGWDRASIEADCSGAGDELNGGGCPASEIGGCDESREDPQGTLVWYYVGEFYDRDDAANLEYQCVGSYYEWHAG